MFIKSLMLVLSVFVFSGLSSITIAGESEEIIFGRDLMTKEEITEHRTQVRSMKTTKEREAYRRQHHEKMTKRAKEMGVEIPAEPMRRGSHKKPRDEPGMGRGSGMGGGPRGM